MDGFLVIDKPAGWTSHDVVAKARRVLKIKKVGHTGTLDPFATGVLVLCLGRATRLTRFLREEIKEYQGEMVLGVRTDTLDGTGRVLSQKPCQVSRDEVVKVFREFQGEILQTPPLTSAVKFKGKPLYKWARQGVQIKARRRKVKIFDLKCLNLKKDQHPVVSFRVKCSKGTYVRTLCSDMGEKLSCGAHLNKLVRLSSGDFRFKQALSLENLEKYVEGNRLQEIVVTPNKALPEYPSVVVKKDFVSKILKGVSLSQGMIKKEPPFISKGTILKVVDLEQNLLAMAQALVSFPSRENNGVVVAKPLCVLAESN